MLDRRPSLAAAAATTCAAFTLWVSSGSLAFETASAQGGYVGLLPSVWWLGILLSAAVAVTLLLKPPVDVVRPLWLSVVVILPWLPVPLPLSVFLWTGSVRLWLWVAIGAAVAGPRGVPRLVSASRTAGNPWRAAIAAGLLSACAFGLGAWALAPEHPGGDEPHYLVIAQSLIKDHDLQIENNHQQGDYSAYYDGPLKPDYLRRGTNGQIYSIHAPGLPLLVAPVLALFGYPGVVVSLGLLSAAAGALVWFVCWRVTRDDAASWFGWAGAALSAPFFLHASAVYPDGVGAVIVLGATLPLLEPRARRPAALVAQGLSLALLPWLHTRFAILAATAALVVTGRILSEQQDRTKRLAAFVAIPVVSAAAWLTYFRLVYGVFDPAAPYGGATNTSAENIVRGIPGLLFDQQFGLLPNAPVFLCAVLGLGAMLRRRSERRLPVELWTLTLPYFIAVAFFYMWWGGFSAPARFLVPLTLLLSVPAAAWFSTHRSPAARVAGCAALLASLAVTASMSVVDGGSLSINVRDGASRLLTWLSPVADLTTALPSLFQNPPARASEHAAIWLAAVGVAVLAAVVVGRRVRTPSSAQQLSIAVLTFGLVAEATSMAAVSFVWQSNRAMVAKPDSGAWALLRQYEPESQQLVVGYQPLRRIHARDVPSQLPLTRPVPDVNGEWSTMLHLPPGTYEVRGRRSTAADGLVRVVMDSESTPIAQWPVASLPENWAARFTLPVGVAAIRVDLDSAAKRAVRDVEVRAVSILPRRNRLSGDPEATRLARYGPAVVFLLGGSAWVEPAGTWVAGGKAAEFAVYPDGARPIHLFVRNGATANQVRLGSGAWHADLALTPGEERVIDLPAEERVTTPVSVSSARGFRPAQVDPKSQDQRFLGVWIETR